MAFTIDSDEITESSSLALSTTHRGLVYTANDSGDGPRVYALNDRNGSLVRTTTLSGVTADDIEALAIGADGDLLVGDIGDNHAERPDITVYRLPQPGRGDSSVTPDRLTLRYDDGPQDAEAMVFDPDSGRIFIASKGFAGNHVYRSPRDVFSRDRAVLRQVADAPPLTTDATLLPGGRIAVLRTYFAAVFYRFPSWQRLQTIELPPQRQGESVAVSSDGKDLWIGSEGNQSMVLSVPLPDLTPEPPPAPSTSAVPQPTSQSGSESEGDGASLARAVLGGGGLLLLAAVILLVFRARRSRT